MTFDSPLKKLEGHLEQGYIYGNPTMHNNSDNPPLRPIISQIVTAVYETVKSLNPIITPYMPKQNMVESTHGFIDIAKAVDNPTCLATFDVESLFTNVPN